MAHVVLLHYLVLERVGPSRIGRLLLLQKQCLLIILIGVLLLLLLIELLPIGLLLGVLHLCLGYHFIAYDALLTGNSLF